MDCPYCAEAIKDEAVACRHCGRDIALVKDHLKKIADLENQIAGSTSSADAPRTKHRVSVNLSVTQETRSRRILLGMLFAAIVSIAANTVNLFLEYAGIWSDVEPGSLLHLAFVDVSSILAFLHLFFPFLMGLWVALAWPGRHQYGHVLLGLITGLLCLSLQIGADAFLQNRYFDTDVFNYPEQINWTYSFFAFLLTPALMFVSGGFFGDLLKARQFSYNTRRSAASRLARAFTPSTEQPNERLVAFFQSLGPLIPAFLSLLTAAFPLIIYLVTGEKPQK